MIIGQELANVSLREEVQHIPHEILSKKGQIV